MLKLRMPTVEIERLILRPIQLDDDKDMYEYCSDDDVIKYLWFEKHDSIEFSRYVIEKLFLNRVDVGIPEA